MCGIVGVLGGQQVRPAVGAVCLGHRRLAIIDLAAEANQPFVTGDGRFVLVFNGEIYNYRDPDLFERLRLQHTSGAAHHTATLHNLGFFSQWLPRWA
jgi:asparagine synthetase B (glutamine-hydrolysing)